MAYAPLPGAPTSADGVRSYLLDVASRREFRQFSVKEGESGAPAGSRPDGYVPPAHRQGAGARTAAGFTLHPLQGFVERMVSPHSRVPRALFGWETGTGKTIAAITCAQTYAQLFRSMLRRPVEERPRVFVLGFTRAVFQDEMLRDPAHGFITHAELHTLRGLRREAMEARANPGPGAAEVVRQYNGYLGTMRRLLTDPDRGGYFQYYGYKELANALFNLTPAGEAAGLRVLDLFVRAGDAGELTQIEAFARRISAAERKGYVLVNEELRARFRHGLIVADEIHNVYNVSDPNMYGVALQYLLDSFEEGEAPRAIFMSATPVSGSPAEVVDLLNLLVPRAQLPGGRPLRRSDLFTDRDGGAPGALRFLPGKEELVSELAAGRVSFLKSSMEEFDPADPVFPERVFVGEPALGTEGDEVPYLRFVHCPMSELQRAALAHWAASGDGEGARDGGGAPQLLPVPADYGLYDMVFPNPDGGTPIYRNTAYASLSAAPQDWQTTNGVQIARAGDKRTTVVAGDFLQLREGGRPSLAAYSAKYAAFAGAVRETVRTRRGKMLVYHTRVRFTGVNLLAEILRRNGLVAVGEPPRQDTLCSACGRELSAHRQASRACKEFLAARFATVTNDLTTAEKERALGAFNLAANVDGHRVRVLIGSDVIVQGLDFKAVRFLHILSVPRNFATLVQIMGRAVRRGAFASLPPEERRVEVSIYLTSGTVEVGGATVHTPDLVKLTRKKADFLQVQVAQRALWRTAVNGFLPQSQSSATKEPSVDGLPFSLPVTTAEAMAQPENSATYYAYGATEQNVARVAALARSLFARRPVWAEAELRAALRAPGASGGARQTVGAFSDGVVALALARLERPATRARAASGVLLPAAHLVGWDGTPRRVVAAGAPGDRVYVAVPLDGRGDPLLDAESYLRPAAGAPRAAGLAGLAGAVVDLRGYSRAHLEGAAVRRRVEQALGDLEARHGAPGGAADAHRETLAALPARVHYEMLESFVALGSAACVQKAHGRAGRAQAETYEAFRLLVTSAQLKEAARSRDGYGGVLRGTGRAGRPCAYVGYLGDRAVRVWQPTAGGEAGWTDVPLEVLGVGPRTAENDSVVGFAEEKGGRVRFKVREPLHELGRRRVRDVRSLSRGAVCDTRARDTQLGYAARLTGRARGALRALGSGELCALVLCTLLRAEEKARGGRDGMRAGVRWFYLFNETLPTVRVGADAAQRAG